MKSHITVLALFGAALSATPVHAGNTTTDGFSAQRRHYYRPIATRLEVYPSSRQVRRCIDWYQIEHRPSGTVLTPQMRCWWARK